MASRFAVQSAVFYWTRNDINALADIDDVKRVTKKINGGFNGLADRVELLDHAKELLKVDAEPTGLERATHTVKATKLNLRSRPETIPATRIGSLDHGAEVMKLADAGVDGWVRVRAVLGGQISEGFVAERFLEPAPRPVQVVSPPAPVADVVLPVAHMAENRPDITRLRDGGRAFALGEPGRPRRTAVKPGTQVRQLVAIATYLDSENPKHKRYWPKAGTTFCNIYAYDYCYLTGAYLPRVWWKESALSQIRDGADVAVRYDKTVRELNANMIHDWVEDHGRAYGWRRVLDLDVLQAAANKGEVCIIVAKRSDLNRSGHIVAVVPEHDGFEASRKASGELLRPVQSQAGIKNHRFFVGRPWWRQDKFQAFSFWRHA